MGEHVFAGVMSGSSLDGLDLAVCRFVLKEGRLESWAPLAGKTLPLPHAWRERLRQLSDAGPQEVAAAHAAYGRWVGQRLRHWLDREGLRPSGAGFHGHTLFHDPDGSPGYSVQIGDGAYAAAASGIPVITDFRNADIAAGGQGAPMAPLADTLLFPGYDAWLNIGGIANITVAGTKGRISARDVCGANQLLNALAALKGRSMDRDGRLAAKGRVLDELLHQANTQTSPSGIRSLSNQEVREGVVRLFLSWPGAVEDRMATATRWVAARIAEALPEAGIRKEAVVMVTGGGAFNRHLLLQLQDRLSSRRWSLLLPSADTIRYKEAWLMALAGLYRCLHIPNFVQGVTGSRKAVCGGALFLPPSSYLRS